MNKYKKLNKREMNLDYALERKLEREFNDFKKGLNKLPKDKIIEKAYEITSKEEIKDTLINMDLHDLEKEIIFLQEDVLNEFYHDWLDCDVPLGESMQDSIRDSIAIMTRYMGKRRLPKER